MKIAINCRCFSKKQYTGIGRYAYHLAQSLLDIDQKNNYLFYTKKRWFDRTRRIPHLKGKNFRLINDRFNRGLSKTLQSSDIYHSPCPDHFDIDQIKIIVTIHDLIYKTYPHGHTDDTIRLTDEYVKKSIDRADRIICCSQSTMDDLIDLFPVDSKKVSLVYQGVDKNVFYPQTQEEKDFARSFLHSQGIDSDYIFFVGTIEPRKNLEGIIKAFAILKDKGKFSGKLVVAGMKGWMSDGLSGLVDQLGIGKDVILLGFVSDAQLRLLYNSAKVFVFPSFYEGFGFPILEAFCCKTPVITSNISSCPEVAQDAALKIDPHRPENIAEAIMQIIEDDSLREQLIENGFQRANDFSFVKTAEETLKVYEEVYNGHGG